MSTSDLYLVFKSKVRHFAEYGNGHGSAPPVWDLIWDHHVQRGEKFPMFDQERSKRLWGKAYDKAVPLHRRMGLTLTLDLAYIPVANLDECAAGFDLLHAEILESGWTWSHWPAIAADFRLINKKNVRRLIGVGLSCTSVCDPWQEWKPKDGKKPFDGFAYATHQQAA